MAFERHVLGLANIGMGSNSDKAMTPMLVIAMLLSQGVIRLHQGRGQLATGNTTSGHMQVSTAKSKCSNVQFEAPSLLK
jgi:hypothetical protein